LFATVLGPPLFGGLAYAVLLLFLLIFTEDAPTNEKVTGAVALVVLSVIWAYIFVGAQSLVAGLLMEFVVRRLATRKYHIVVSAAVMGLLAAVTYRMDSPFVMILGLLVGTLSGVFLSHSFQAVQPSEETG